MSYRNLVLGLDTEVSLSDGKKVPAVYFDNASTTPPFTSVIDEIVKFAPMYANVNGGQYQKATYTEKLFEDARIILIANRIPRDYVITRGFGDTDLGSGSNPWEAGSFDLARVAAKIENFNIVRYSSILPPEAKEITIEEARTRNLYHPGAVMEAIISQANGYKGERLCAGIGTIKVKNIPMAHTLPAMWRNI